MTNEGLWNSGIEGLGDYSLRGGGEKPPPLYSTRRKTSRDTETVEKMQNGGVCTSQKLHLSNGGPSQKLHIAEILNLC